MNEADDAEVLRRVRAGERDAYAALVRKYRARVIGLCRLLVGSADAEDAAQEAFFKAYRSLAEYRGGSSFYTWLYRIASNHCLSVLRARGRRPEAPLDALAEEKKDRLTALFAAAPDPRTALGARELVERVLACLRPNYRLVLLLRERDGMSYEEIARVLGASEDSVKAQLRRARDEVEEKLRHFLPPDGV